MLESQRHTRPALIIIVVTICTMVVLLVLLSRPKTDLSKIISAELLPTSSSATVSAWGSDSIRPLFSEVAIPLDNSHVAQELQRVISMPLSRGGNMHYTEADMPYGKYLAYTVSVRFHPSEDILLVQLGGNMTLKRGDDVRMGVYVDHLVYEKILDLILKKHLQ